MYYPTHQFSVCACLGFFNEQPPQHQCVKFVFICTRERTVLQGQMLLSTSKGCCTVYYSEDAIEEQGIFLKEYKRMQLYWLNEELLPLFAGYIVF